MSDFDELGGAKPGMAESYKSWLNIYRPISHHLSFHSFW